MTLLSYLYAVGIGEVGFDTVLKGTSMRSATYFVLALCMLVINFILSRRGKVRFGRYQVG